MKMQLRHFRQVATRHESSSLVLKEKRFANNFTMNSNPLKNEENVTEPVWYLINLQRESPHGAPSPPFIVRKYQTETAEQSMN